MTHTKGFLGEFVLLIVVALIAGGWIANVVKLVGMMDGGVTTMFIMRIVGAVFAPLGVILGYI